MAEQVITKEEKKKVGCETYVLDYNGNLYGKKIRVDFCKFIRAERKFDSLEALTAEVRENIKEIRKYFEK